jgi:hypothetical protein
MIGTGTTTTNPGDTPAPFGSLFRLNELQDLENRFRVVLAGLLIGLVYTAFLLMLLEFAPIDIAIMLGTAFLAYRVIKLGDEIQEMKQYLHGEGVLASE